MSLKSAFAITLAFFGILICFPIYSQVVPAATVGGLPLSAGGGFSNYDVDWGHGRMGGGALWIDWHVQHLPHMLSGLGVEAEARDTSLGGTSYQPSNFRLDSAGGGVIYSFNRFPIVHPYAKALVGLGAIDWNNPEVAYSHETRTIDIIGAGFDVHAYRHIWVRADFEYQLWPDLLVSHTGSHYLDPQGFTLGAMYDFRAIHPR